MPVAGIDVGSQTTKVVILNDGQVVGQSVMVSAEEAETGARKALDEALQQAGLALSDLTTIVATGAGRKDVSFAQKQKTSLSCLAKGINRLLPAVRTLIDVGAESSTVIRINEKGGVDDSIGHDRCASGTGAFLESMAKLMQMPLPEMGQESLKAQRRAEVSSMCAIFAEQEVISHVHRVPPTPKADIIAGIHGSMAVRIVGLAKRIGVKPEIALTGGVARNVGFARVIEEELKQKVVVPDNPQIVAALGAARIAQEEGGKQ
ncbi:MAG: 2-hydroxyglutaryl-CoA dehydratase [Chloroflexi bacterium]|nr:2-hydroxyglutaryl-CoA dehydratase [Chloroflexota bacterium]